MLREPNLPVAVHDPVSWELKLLVDRREDLVGQRVGDENCMPFRQQANQINTAIHRIAVVQSRLIVPYEGRRAEGDSGATAVRCLKRRLCRVVFNRLRADYARRPRLET